MCSTMSVRTPGLAPQLFIDCHTCFIWDLQFPFDSGPYPSYLQVCFGLLCLNTNAMVVLKRYICLDQGAGAPVTRGPGLLGILIYPPFMAQRTYSPASINAGISKNVHLSIDLTFTPQIKVGILCIWCQLCGLNTRLLVKPRTHYKALVDHPTSLKCPTQSCPVVSSNFFVELFWLTLGVTESILSFCEVG